VTPPTEPSERRRRRRRRRRSRRIRRTRRTRRIRWNRCTSVLVYLRTSVLVYLRTCVQAHRRTRTGTDLSRLRVVVRSRTRGTGTRRAFDRTSPNSWDSLRPSDRERQEPKLLETSVEPRYVEILLRQQNSTRFFTTNHCDRTHVLLTPSTRRQTPRNPSDCPTTPTGHRQRRAPTAGATSCGPIAGARRGGQGTKSTTSARPACDDRPRNPRLLRQSPQK
jgi:hypothetical protein